MRARQHHNLPIHDGEVAVYSCLICFTCIGPVIVKIEHGGWLVLRVAKRVVEGRLRVGVQSGHLHTGRRVPVPEWHCKSRVIDQTSQNPFEEIEVPPVKK